MANKITIRLNGRKRTFPTIRAAAKAARMPYITFYQRVKQLGMPPSTAFKKPVRTYNRAA